MGFLSRLLSSDYRRALAAEAAGDFPLAARLYASCGESLKVAEMHFLGIPKQAGREDILRGLREAARWAQQVPAEAAAPILRKIARRLEREAAGQSPTAPADRELLREAAGLYEAAGAFREAARCVEQLGESAQAAELYGRAGDLSRMERLLDREREQGRAAFELREAWDSYRMDLAAGRREAARAALVRCCDSPLAGNERAEYLRLRDDLDARRYEGWITLRAGNELPVAYTSTFPVWLGRDGASGLPLRDASVSRQHARIDADLTLTDCGSKNGTRLNQIPIGGALPLEGRGELALGDDCVLTFEAGAGRLELSVLRGRERGHRLIAQPGPIVLGAGVELRFERGRPLLRATAPLQLNGVVAATEIEPIRGDHIALGGSTWQAV